MGTLELRITAVKPSTDGERVRHDTHYSGSDEQQIICFGKAVSIHCLIGVE